MCDTRNAKSELLSTVGDCKIVCARISVHPSAFDEQDEKEYKSLGLNSESFTLSLKSPHTQEELNTFLDKLDFLYNSGYGSMEVSGTVWLENNQWLTRGEYDGSEWWDFNLYPDIPEELENKFLEREININKIENEDN